VEGRELKEQGVDRVASRSIDFQDRAALAIGRLAMRGKMFTAEDVRELVGDPPHPNAMGAALRIASREGAIIACGWKEASRGSAHGRVLRLWTRS